MILRVQLQRAILGNAMVCDGVENLVDVFSEVLEVDFCANEYICLSEPI